jgi:hypothetical protein
MNKLRACDAHSDCFANKGGLCIALNDTNFEERDCPFYKTEEEHRASRQRSFERLLILGRHNLTERNGEPWE